MSDNKLALTNNTTMNVIPSREEWSTIHDMAKALLPTGFLPQSIKTPEQATAIMLKGRELNVPPMYALSNIVVVQGKPTVSAEMMLALVQRDHGLNSMWVEESTNEKCTVGYKSGNGTKFYTWTVEDANAAGLTKNPTWRSYPAAMCRARAISAVARMAFPGSIAGMYVPGELGDDVTVTEDGEIISASITGPQDTSAQNGAGRDEPQKMTPDTQTRQTPPQRPAQAPTATIEPEPDVLDQFPIELLDAIADWWNYESVSAMPETQKRNLRVLLAGKGRPKEKQEKFDQFVADWEEAQAAEYEDGVIEADVVEQGDLTPGEDTIPTPASFFTK